jgi:hypothetical protein
LFVETDAVLSAFTTFTPPVPHKKLVDLYGTSSVLLLVLHGYKDAEGYMPGKLFEYLATGLPVLAVGPPGDASRLLQETGAGEMIDAHQTDKLANFILQKFEQWKNGNSPSPSNKSLSASYSRKAVTQSLTGFLS